MATLAKLLVAFMVVVAAPSARAVQHVVGGSSGWGSSANGFYDTWAAGQTFTVGDTLLFNYGLNHGVDQVSQSDYQSCTIGNALQSYSGGQTTIPLNNTGPLYFVCPTLGHCAGQGMKLSITVAAASSGGSPPTSPSGGGSPPTSPSGGGSSPTSPSSGGSPPATTTNTPRGGAAAGNMNQLVIGFSVVLAVVVSCMI